MSNVNYNNWGEIMQAWERACVKLKEASIQNETEKSIIEEDQAIEWRKLSGISENAKLDAIQLPKVQADTQGEDQKIHKSKFGENFAKIEKLRLKLEELTNKMATMENTEVEESKLDSSIKKIEDEITELSNLFVKD